MRRIAIACMIAVVGLAGSQPAAARHTRHSYHGYSAGGGSDAYYTARSGHRVHRPTVANSAPAGASAHCRDGSWSFSESRRGTCSHHGGVASWR